MESGIISFKPAAVTAGFEPNTCIRMGLKLQVRGRVGVELPRSAQACANPELKAPYSHQTGFYLPPDDDAPHTFNVSLGV